MYHFISGYTAKVAGNEMGVDEPVPSFNSCFAEAFLPLHPSVYASLLGKQLKRHGSHIWLINTGYYGGKYGQGERIDVDTSRTILDEIHAGNLDQVETTPMDVFGLHVPNHVNGVDSNFLHPKNTWMNKEDYDETLKMLANKFIGNFRSFEQLTPAHITAAGPKL